MPLVFPDHPYEDDLPDWDWPFTPEPTPLAEASAALSHLLDRFAEWDARRRMWRNGTARD